MTDLRSCSDSSLSVSFCVSCGSKSEIGRKLAMFSCSNSAICGWSVLGKHALERKSAICMSFPLSYWTSMSYFWSLIIISWRGVQVRRQAVSSRSLQEACGRCWQWPSLQTELVERFKGVHNGQHFLLYLGVACLSFLKGTAGIRSINNI